MAELLSDRLTPRQRLRQLLLRPSPVLAGEQVLCSWGEGGLTPPTSIEELCRWGFSVVVFPVAALFASVTAIRDVLGRMASDGTPINAFDEMGLPHLDDFFDLVGMQEINDIGKRYPHG